MIFVRLEDECRTGRKVVVFEVVVRIIATSQYKIDLITQGRLTLYVNAVLIDVIVVLVCPVDGPTCLGACPENVTAIGKTLSFANSR